LGGVAVSVINTMLRDLDRRRVEVDAGNGYQYVRAVASQPQWRAKAIVLGALALLAAVVGVFQILERVSPPASVPFASSKNVSGASKEPRAVATPLRATAIKLQPSRSKKMSKPPWPWRKALKASPAVVMAR
jgi:hypothetical protein